jgi:peptidoglycan hydrolase-like protein with peptidoglycan-binding domain
MNSKVAAAQAALNRTMGAGLTVDGVYGPRTRQAVIAFQRSRGLKPDGVLGARTYTALGVAAAAPGPAPMPPPVRPAGPVPPEKQETDPPRLTLYFRMPHGGEHSAPTRSAQSVRGMNP